jgi:hypothetical protein
MTVPAVAEATTYSLRLVPLEQVRDDAPPVRRPEGGRPAGSRRGGVSVEQWMAIRQAYYSDQHSLREVARLTRVSRRKVRRVLWPLQAD